MRLALVFALLTTAASAQSVVPVPYDDLLPLAPNLVTFDRLPSKPFPGYSFDHGIAFPGGRLGERLTGQTLGTITPHDGGPHDVLINAPALPLSIASAAPGEGVSLSLHRAYGSMALYPLGPLKQPHPQARGEGAVAIVFQRDVCAMGLLVHTQYTNALGLNAGHRGDVTLTLYARDGVVLSLQHLTPPEGVSGIAVFDPTARIAAATIENADPGGISMDDLRFGCPALTG